ncbi:type IV pilus modification protein PilV [Janthinobacterium sp. 17J80-10]|uniref:type IV pilus modification protein PilV n=1 Tax=Janthinobacterium sp. 17J80-10 TaxID=2497863 RepID=UPI0010056BFE|nr:type IV pilus modification protein PilV [Janthinobacterium sp. 17J80-10]QAU33791.1 type IV pilus modification protein PilV [Janthinobacterium sp. 17J80-10]
MTTPRKPVASPNKQAGMMLLECLIAILIFSFGILALIGMQTMAVKQVTDAKYRSEAGVLVSQLFGSMWASRQTPATLQDQFGTDKPAYATWAASVSATLPGVNTTTTKPTVTITADGVVTVTVFWAAPNDEKSYAATGSHKYVAVAQIR